MCLISIPIQLSIPLSFLSCGQPDDDDDDEKDDDDGNDDDDDDDDHVWLKHILILPAEFAVFVLGKDGSPLFVTSNRCVPVKKYIGLKCSCVFLHVT
jgi:hypothetical protein